ncbi:MAG: C1 family peptidase [Pseudobdellovibrionaceae bacterium]
MRSLVAVCTILCITLTIFLFQNCSRVQFNSDQASSSVAVTSVTSGNLEGSSKQVPDHYLLTPTNKLQTESLKSLLLQNNASIVSLTPEGTFIVQLSQGQYSQINKIITQKNQGKIEPFSVFVTKSLPLSGERATGVLPTTETNLKTRLSDEQIKNMLIELTNELSNKSHINRSLKLVPAGSSKVQNKSISMNPNLITNFPEKIDNSLSKYFPPIVSQGSHGSCVAHAYGYYNHSYLQARLNDFDLRAADKSKICSPAFLYSLGNRGKDGPKDGVDVQVAHRILQDFGCASLASLSYEPNDPRVTLPTSDSFIDGINSRIEGEMESFQVDSWDSINLIRGKLAQGQLAAGLIAADFIFKSYPRGNFSSNDVIRENAEDANSSTENIGHAVTIVGYDDNKEYFLSDGTIKRGALLLANSWGSDWGVGNSLGSAGTKGYFWYGYEGLANGKILLSSWSIAQKIKPASKFVATGTLKNGSYLVRDSQGQVISGDLSSSAFQEGAGISPTIALDLGSLGPGGTKDLVIDDADHSDYDFPHTLKMLHYKNYNINNLSYSTGVQFQLQVDLNSYSSDNITPCIGKNPGETCSDGLIYLGSLNGFSYETTPGNCSDSATPFCPGGPDTLMKKWINATVDAFTQPTGATSLSNGTNNTRILTGLVNSGTDAALYCQKMKYAGYVNEMFLPASDELKLFWDAQQNGHKIPGISTDSKQILPDGYSTWGYWSSSESLISIAAASKNVEFIYGSVTERPKDRLALVRCVRKYYSGTNVLSPVQPVTCPSQAIQITSPANNVNQTQNCTATLGSSSPSTQAIVASVTNGGNYSRVCQNNGQWADSPSSSSCPAPSELTGSINASFSECTIPVGSKECAPITLTGTINNLSSGTVSVTHSNSAGNLDSATITSNGSYSTNLKVSYGANRYFLNNTNNTLNVLLPYTVTASCASGAIFSNTSSTCISVSRYLINANGCYNLVTNNLEVVGNTGTEALKIPKGYSGVLISANIERLELGGEFSAYRFITTGSGLKIQDLSGTNIVTVLSINQDTTIRFANGSAVLTQTADGFQLGGVKISSSVASTLSISLNTNDASNFNTPCAADGKYF